MSSTPSSPSSGPRCASQMVTTTVATVCSISVQWSTSISRASPIASASTLSPMNDSAHQTSVLKSNSNCSRASAAPSHTSNPSALPICVACMTRACSAPQTHFHSFARYVSPHFWPILVKIITTKEHIVLTSTFKVWFEITLHFCHKGSESQEKLLKTSFEVRINFFLIWLYTVSRQQTV